MKTVLKIAFFFLLFLYISTVVLLFAFFRLPYTKYAINNYILTKTGYETSISGLKFTVSEILAFKLHIDKISSKKDDDLLLIDDFNISFLPFNKDKNKIDINSINLNKTIVDKNKSNTKFDYDKFLNILSNLPDISVNKAEFNIDKKNCFKINANLSNLVLLTKNGKKTLSFNLNLNSDFINSPLRISSSDKFIFLNDGIYTDGIYLHFKNSSALISGKIFDRNNKSKFFLKSKNLSVSDAINSFILYKKQKSNSKLFIENFKDYKGSFDSNLVFDSGKINGTILIHKISATTVPLNVPIEFSNPVFIFDNSDVYTSSKGLLGGEPVNLDMYFTLDKKTSSKTVSGSIKTKLTDKFSNKYIDKLFIKNDLHLGVDYFVKDGVADVFYSADIPIGADISYSGAKLGLTDTNRKLGLTTRKNGDTITLVNYIYSVNKDGIDNEIIFGNGEFKKINGKYKLYKINGTTKTNAPVSLLGFIENRLKGGFFSGNVTYDYLNRSLFGSFVIQDTVFKNFKIKNAAVFADSKLISILADGTFKKEPFSAEIDIKNSLKNHLYIDKLHLFLNKFSFTKTNKSKSNTIDMTFDKIENYYDKVTINDMNIRLNEFRKDNIVLKNITLIGSVTDNKFNFIMPDIMFSGGILSSKGSFNFDNNKAIVDFSADGIDSSVASFQLFNLKEQIKGKMSAKLHVETTEDKDTFLIGRGTFFVNRGYLPKIGTTQFALKTSKRKHPFRFSMSDIFRIKSSRNYSPISNIKGDFNFTDELVDNMNVYLQNDVLSLYINGDCDIKDEYANISVLGRYDKDIESGIKILFIPIRWVLKFLFKEKEDFNVYSLEFEKVPELKAPADRQKNFAIDLDGNLNNFKKINFKLRGLR